MDFVICCIYIIWTIDISRVVITLLNADTTWELLIGVDAL